MIYIFFTILFFYSKLISVEAPYKMSPELPLDTIMNIVEEKEKYTKYQVEFNGINERIPADLYIPKNKDEPKSCTGILLAYGWDGDRNKDYVVGPAIQLANEGFVTLIIEAPNCGVRKNAKTKNMFLQSFDEVMKYCSDYSRGTDFLLSLPNVDEKKVSFIGLSMGSINGIVYVAYDPRVRAMCSLVAGGNFLGLYSFKQNDKIARVIDPVYHIGRIAPRPLLLVNVKNDKYMKEKWAQSLHRAAGEGSEVIWFETDHKFNSIGPEKAVDCCIEFLNRVLSSN